ncbi:hypothetical protein J6590_024912 [Homalodisca vitripennis]|nr:hypothetical protein J6590_024912 [Homalodisca vitripennis]
MQCRRGSDRVVGGNAEVTIRFLMWFTMGGGVKILPKMETTLPSNLTLAFCARARAAGSLHYRPHHLLIISAVMGHSHPLADRLALVGQLKLGEASSLPPKR